LDEKTKALVREFDSGTDVTIRLTGQKADGAERVVVMFAPIPDAINWWIVALLGLTIGMSLGLAVWQRRRGSSVILRWTSVMSLSALAALAGAWLLGDSVVLEFVILVGVAGLLVLQTVRFIPTVQRG
jgi:hypothetical protein